MFQVACGLIVAMCLFAGCSDNHAVNLSAERKRVKSMQLKDWESGYLTQAADWQGFLACWRNGVAQRAAKENASNIVLTVLSKFTQLSRDPQPSVADTETQLSHLEARLGTTLPKSYIDFVRVYRPPIYRPHDAPGGGILRVGMFGPQQVGFLSQLEPRLAQQSAEIPVETSDAEYYVYGINQSDVAIRTGNRPGAIVVGSHGPAAYDLIVMYPQEKTRDGEMEAALIFHSGEFRAPSFAELMRQLAYMEINSVDRVPPYRQSDIAHGCAKFIPLSSVWWK
jgi:hypothetical protein